MLNKYYKSTVVSYILIFIMWSSLEFIWMLFQKRYRAIFEDIETLIGLGFSLRIDEVITDFLLFVVAFLFMFITRIFIQKGGYAYLSSEKEFVGHNLFLSNHREIIHLFFIFIASLNLFLSFSPSLLVSISASVFSFIYFMMGIWILDSNNFGINNFITQLKKIIKVLKKYYNSAVVSYILSFVTWISLGFSWIIFQNRYRAEFEKTETLIGLDFSLKVDEISAGLLLFVVAFLFISRIFIRVDGYMYLSSKKEFISDPLFRSSNRKIIHVFFIFIASLSLFLTFSPSLLVSISASVFSFVYFMMGIWILDSSNFGKNNLTTQLKNTSKKFKYYIYSISLILLINNIYSLGVFKSVTHSIIMTRILIILGIFIPFGYIIVFSLWNIFIFVRNKLKIIKDYSLNMVLKRTGLFLLNILFMEYRAADQSKRNAENLAMLKSIYEEAKTNTDIDFKSSKLKELLLLSNWTLFINDKDEELSFLELKRRKDYIMFLNKVKDESDNYKNFSDLEKMMLLEFKQHHKYFVRAVMDARTVNIISRNRNNMLIGISLFLITLLMIFIDSIYSSELFQSIFSLMMIGVIVRLIYRSSEICRAFYFDLVEGKLPKTYLSGQNRITLAIKSLIEIILLCGTVYLSYSMSSNLMSLEPFRVGLVVKTVGYSLAASLFNVSYPGLLIEYNEINDFNDVIVLMTHILQIFTSVVLLTMSIAGYLNFPKIPMYYYLESNDNEISIVKKSFDESLKKELITINYKEFQKEGVTNQEVYREKIKINYKNGRISEEDAKFSMELVDFQDAAPSNASHLSQLRVKNV